MHFLYPLPAGQPSSDVFARKPKRRIAGTTIMSFADVSPLTQLAWYMVTNS